MLFLTDKLEELRSRAKGIEPPAARLQAAMRALAECQVKRDKAEKHLAEAKVSYDRAEQALAAAQEELEQEQMALSPSARSACPGHALSEDFYDELENVKAAAQWDSQGNVVLPHSMLQSLFSRVPPPSKPPERTLSPAPSTPIVCEGDEAAMSEEEQEEQQFGEALRVMLQSQS
eukprot:8898564-Lingulodinium_polyedra.AAC.1